MADPPEGAAARVQTTQPPTQHPLLSSRDLLTNVFSFLDPSSLGRATAVSRTWRDVSRSGVLWHRHLETQFAAHGACADTLVAAASSAAAAAAPASSAAAAAAAPTPTTTTTTASPAYLAFSFLADRARYMSGRPHDCPLATHALNLGRFEAAKAAVGGWRLRFERARGDNAAPCSAVDKTGCPPSPAPLRTRSGQPWGPEHDKRAEEALKEIDECASENDPAAHTSAAAAAAAGMRSPAFRHLGAPLETPQALWIRFKLPRATITSAVTVSSLNEGLVDAVLEARVGCCSGGSGAQGDQQQASRWIEVARCPRFFVPQGDDQKRMEMSHLYGLYAYDPQEEEEEEEEEEDGGCEALADGAWWRDLSASQWERWRSLVAASGKGDDDEEDDKDDEDQDAHAPSSERHSVRVVGYVHFEQLLAALDPLERRRPADAPPLLQPPACWPVSDAGHCHARARLATRHALHHAWPTATPPSAAANTPPPQWPLAALSTGAPSGPEAAERAAREKAAAEDALALGDVSGGSSNSPFASPAELLLSSSPAGAASAAALAPSHGGYLLVASCFRLGHPAKQRLREALKAAAGTTTTPTPDEAPDNNTSNAHLGTAAVRLFLSAPIREAKRARMGDPYEGDMVDKDPYAVLDDFAPGDEGMGFVRWSLLMRELQQRQGGGSGSSGRSSEPPPPWLAMRERAVDACLGYGSRVSLRQGLGAMDAMVALPPEGGGGGEGLPGSLAARLAAAAAAEAEDDADHDEESRAWTVRRVDPSSSTLLTPAGATHAALLLAAAATTTPTPTTTTADESPSPQPSIFAGQGAVAQLFEAACEAGYMLDLALYDPHGRLLLGRAGVEMWDDGDEDGENGGGDPLLQEAFALFPGLTPPAALAAKPDPPAVSEAAVELIARASAMALQYGRRPRLGRPRDPRVPRWRDGLSLRQAAPMAQYATQWFPSAWHLLSVADMEQEEAVVGGLSDADVRKLLLMTPGDSEDEDEEDEGGSGASRQKKKRPAPPLPRSALADVRGVLFKAGADFAAACTPQGIMGRRFSCSFLPDGGWLSPPAGRRREARWQARPCLDPLGGGGRRAIELRMRGPPPMRGAGLGGRARAVSLSIAPAAWGALHGAAVPPLSEEDAVRWPQGAGGGILFEERDAGWEEEFGVPLRSWGW